MNTFRIGCCLLAVLSGCVFGETSAGLNATVTDATGAVVRGAKVSIYQTEKLDKLGAEKNIVTDTEGCFSLDLLPGRYHLVLTMAGFKEITKELEIGSGERVQRSWKMDVQPTIDVWLVEMPVQPSTSEIPDQIPFILVKPKK